MGKQRVALGIAGVFVLVALVYLVKPFTMSAPMGGWFGYAPVSGELQVPVGSTVSFQVECSAPWRQVVDPPTVRAEHELQGSSVVDNVISDPQPACENAGRSRAIVSFWLLAAAVAIVALTGAWRRPRSDDAAPDPEPVVVDVI